MADFLLGMPQLATIQVGGETRLKERTFALYVEDNWQRSSRMTINWGLRYEVWLPYVETNGQMANLDVTSGFTAASVRQPADVGRVVDDLDGHAIRFELQEVVHNLARHIPWKILHAVLVEVS